MTLNWGSVNGLDEILMANSSCVIAVDFISCIWILLYVLFLRLGRCCHCFPFFHLKKVWFFDFVYYYLSHFWMTFQRQLWIVQTLVYLCVFYYSCVYILYAHQPMCTPCRVGSRGYPARAKVPGQSIYKVVLYPILYVYKHSHYGSVHPCFLALG